MKEIIPICFGQCGNNIGSDFINNIYREHFHHDSNNDDSIQIRGDTSVYFSESHNKRNNNSSSTSFTSRALFVHPNYYKSNIKQTLLNNSHFVDENNLLWPQNDSFTACAWPGGRYSPDADTLADVIVDRVRKLVEDCDSFHGFQFFHSLIGASSGFCSRIMTTLREEYPDRVNWACPVFSASGEGNGVWMYDSLLSIHYLHELTDFVTCVHNSELIEKLKKKEPKYSDLNNSMQSYFPNITSVFRFPTQQGCDLRKMCQHLCSGYSQKFVDIGGSIVNRNDFQSVNESIYNVASHLFQKIGPKSSVLSAVSVFRMNSPILSRLEVDRIMGRVVKNHAQQVIFNHPFKSLVVENSAPSNDSNNSDNNEEKISSTFLVNSSSIVSHLQHIYDIASLAFKRKAFIYGYTSAGLDEMEITEAQYCLGDIIDMYRTSLEQQQQQEQSVNTID